MSARVLPTIGFTVCDVDVLERGLEVFMRELTRLELRAVQAGDRAQVERLRVLGDRAIAAKAKLRRMRGEAPLS